MFRFLHKECMMNKSHRTVRNNNRSLRMEQLEEKLTLAAMPVVGTYPVISNPTPVAVVAENLATPPATLLQGAQKATLTQIDLSAGKNQFVQVVANTTQFVVLPGSGGWLPNDVQSVSFCVDADGNSANGFERNLGTGRIDYTSGVAIITANQSAWFGNNKPMHCALVADINSWAQDNTISAQIVMTTGLKDLGGNTIAPESVNYIGDAPINTVLTDSYQLNQMYTTHTYESVNAGGAISKIVELNGYGNNASLTSVGFNVTNPGNLGTVALNADSNWDGVADLTVSASVVNTGANTGQVTFVLPGNGVTSSTDLWVSGTAAVQPMASDNTFAVSFAGKATGIDNATGKPLQGEILNGNVVPGTNGGQLIAWTNSPVTTYAVVANPKLVVTDGVPQKGYTQPQNVGYSQTVVAANLDIKNTGSSTAGVTEVQYSAVQGDLNALKDYTLQLVTNTGVKMQVATGAVVSTPQGKAVDFIMSSTNVPVGTTQHFEVDAVTMPSATNSVPPYVQLGFMPSGFHASMSGKALDRFFDIFDDLETDPLFYIGSGADLG